MTAITAPSATHIRVRRLPAWVPFLVAVAAAAVAMLLFKTAKVLGGGWVLTAVGAVLLFLIFLATASGVVEGGRAARNRVATSLIYSAFVLALLPLVSVILTLIDKGRGRLDSAFFNNSMRNITAFDSGGGAYHAIVGTLEQVGIATLITVPLGVGAAIYVVEYGRGWLANYIRFFVDVMTGIPSIVAGLFILALWVLIISPHFSANGRPSYSGFAASLALAVLMLPTIARSTEEMLRLVPASLREGSYALGIPRWKTIMSIVVPTALPGIITGVMLAIARAAGETAPVLLVAGGSPLRNFNPFQQNQESLSIYIYEQASLASKYGAPRAWTAALTLVTLVLALTIAAKLLARRNKLNKG
jgi:phosphate transport system permease protein